MNPAIQIPLTSGPLPFVFLNAAITADGKLAPANRRFVPFGSARDKEHLLELRATADAVMSGARTVDTFPVKMGPGGPRFRQLRLRRGLAEYNLRIIVSGSGTIDPGAEIFRHRFSPIIVLTTARANARKLAGLQPLADAVAVCGDEQMDFARAFRWLWREWGVQRLLCEGGGEVNGALVAAGLVDEIHLTICPAILGGRNAPTLADGAGFGKLADAAQYRRASAKVVAGELFAVYRRAGN